MGKRDGVPTRKPTKSSARENELSERLRDLDRELDQHRASSDSIARAQANEPPSRQGYGLALRLGSDFVAAVIVGGALGWGVDKLLGTAPWGMIVLLLAGFVAGVLTVMRSAGLVKPGPAGPDDKI